MKYMIYEWVCINSNNLFYSQKANVSLTRLNKFLNADELDPDAVTKDKTISESHH